jgi:hypothetical protein
MLIVNLTWTQEYLIKHALCYHNLHPTSGGDYFLFPIALVWIKVPVKRKGTKPMMAEVT